VFAVCAARAPHPESLMLPVQRRARHRLPAVEGYPPRLGILAVPPAWFPWFRQPFNLLFPDPSVHQAEQVTSRSPARRKSFRSID